MRLYPNIARVRISCLRLAPKQVCIREPGCLLSVKTYDVSISSDLDLIRVPLSWDQGWTSPVVLLAWVLANGNSIDRAGAVFVETIRISSRQLVDLDLEARIYANERLVVVGVGQAG